MYSDDVEETEEEIELDETDEVVEEEEYSESELEAMAGGWVPKEEYDNPSKPWVDHDEFNRRGELLGAISSLNKKHRQMETTLKAMEVGQKQLVESAYEKGKQALRAELDEAVEDGDVEKAGKISDELEKHVSTRTPEIVANSPEDHNRAMAKFEKDNPWYGEDHAKTAMAQKVYNQYAAENKEFDTLDDMYAAVGEEVVRKVEATTEPAKPTKKPVKLEGNRSKPKKGSESTITLKDIPDHLYDVAKGLVGSGAKLPDLVQGWKDEGIWE